MTLAEARPEEVVSPHEDVLRVVADPMSDVWRDAADIEAKIFMDAGYVESADELSQEYEKYLPATEIAIAQRDGVVAGEIRIINYQEGIGFKTIDDLNKNRLELSPEGREILAGLPLAETLEVGTLGVKEEFRARPEESGRLSVVLFGMAYGLTQEKGCDHVLASFDEKFYRLFKMIFDPSVTPLGPSADYMGSKTIPAYIHVPTLTSHTKEVHPDIYNTMIDAAAKMTHD